MNWQAPPRFRPMACGSTGETPGPFEDNDHDPLDSAQVPAGGVWEQERPPEPPKTMVMKWQTQARFVPLACGSTERRFLERPRISFTTLESRRTWPHRPPG